MGSGAMTSNMTEQERWLTGELKRMIARFDELGALVMRLQRSNQRLREAILRLERCMANAGFELPAMPDMDGPLKTPLDFEETRERMRSRRSVP